MRRAAPASRRRRALLDFLSKKAAVYAIGPKSGAPIKIGFSKLPVSRLNQMQTCCPQKIAFHLLCWTTMEWEAPLLEERCHNILSKEGHHIRGEWFNVTRAEAASAIDRACSDLNYSIVPHDQLVEQFPLSLDPLAGYFWN